MARPTIGIPDEKSTPYFDGEKAHAQARQWVSRDNETQKPLIEYITNEWQTNPKYKEEHDFHPPARAQAYPDSRLDEILDCMDDFYDGFIETIKTPRFWRKALYFVTTIVCMFWMFFSVIRPHMQETQAALATFEEVKPSAGLFGHNQRPNFPDMIQLKTLDPDLLPKDGRFRIPGSRSRRLIFVGDIHGCKDELVELLAKVNFNQKQDHLVTTGDMIDKGPDSVGVVELLRKMNASCVRGNHEDRVLQMRGSLEHMLKGPDGISIQSTSTEEDDAERALARALSKPQAAYLHSCPVILRIGDLGSFGGEVVVVHAGLVPGVPLENQDPSSAMTMRVIDLGTHMPSRDHERKNSIPWAQLWNKVQRLIPKERSRFGQANHALSPEKKRISRTIVIYGHDSRRGLQLEEWTKGLDSDCVKGGKLSALVLSDGGKQNLVQVKCKDHRRLNAPETGNESRRKTPGRKDSD